MKKKLFKNLSFFFFVSSSNRLKNQICCYSKTYYSGSLLIKKKQKKNKNLLKLSSNKFSEIQLITIDLASPDKIKEWAEKKLPNGKIFGQVTNPNTLHYKTLKPLKGGLFCERIFGPIKDFECACGIHKQKPYNRIISFQNKQFCTKCDIEYTWSDIRRYQLGYIELVTPATHLWYLKGMPSYIRSVLGAKRKHIEAIAYCSEIVTIDKAWKPNRLIPFPETISSIATSIKKKKTTLDIVNSTLIYNNNLKQFNYNSNNKNIKFLNQKFVQKKIFNRIINVKKNDTIDSKNFFEQYKTNFIKSNNFKETKYLDINPFFYNIDNYSYKNIVYFYQKTCCSFIQASLDNNRPIYILKILYRSLSNSKAFFNIVDNVYNMDNILYSFNKDVLICHFSDLYIFTKLKKYKKILRYINSKNIYIEKNLMYFKTEKVQNLKYFNNFKIFTIISKNVSFHYLKNSFSFKENNLILKIQFLKKIINLKNYYSFLNNSYNLYVYFNIFSLDFFKNNIFFKSFSKFITFNVINVMKYNFFNTFVMPIPRIFHSIVFKSIINSQFNIIINLKQKGLNSSALIDTSYKILKRKFFIKNFSIYEEANEILWQQFWKICYFFTYTKIIKKLRKIIIHTNYMNHYSILSSLKFLKKIIKKIKIYTKFNKQSNSKNFEINIKKGITKNKFSLFINWLKLYFKKTLFIYQINLENTKKKDMSTNFIILFFKFFKNKIIKIFLKLLNFTLLPWILSQFLFNSKYFSKLEQIKVHSQAQRNNDVKFKKIPKRNLINHVQENSFWNFKKLYVKNNQSLFNKKMYFHSSTSTFFRYYYRFKQKLLIYKNQIQFLFKYKKFRNIWFSDFLKNSFSNSTPYSFKLYNSKLNTIKIKHLYTLNFLFYQKKWILKKKQIFYNYTLFKRLNSNLLIEISFKYFNNFVKLIYSSIYKNELLINLFSIQIKQFYNFIFVQKNQKYFYPHSLIPKSFKKLNYFYSFILFYSKINNKLFLSLIDFNNEKFFLNLLCFLKFVKKNLFKQFNWFKKIKTNFYFFKILKYQKKKQKKSMLKLAKKKILFQHFFYLINSLLFYSQNKLKLINKNLLIKLINKNKISIFHFLKQFQIKLINEIQKYYFYGFENKKLFQVEVNINNFKNIIIFMNMKLNFKKKPFLNSIAVQSNLNLFNQDLIYFDFKKFFYTSYFWQIIIKSLKNRIHPNWLLSFFKYSKDSILIESLSKSNYLNNTLKFKLYFNSFLIKLIFSNSTIVNPLFKLLKKNKNKILQIRQQYCKILKSNHLFFIYYFKNFWNHYLEFPKKNNKIKNNLLFFIFYYQYKRNKNNDIQLKQNNYLRNFYLKYLKHDLNKNFNEAIFSVISESRASSNSSIVWNNIYSLSNRYSWKSDTELNLFLCYMLSPENPSDILIPLYNKRIHSSNVLREEPPLAGGGIILKFLEELDLPEMKKIDIQLQTILKKIPKKLHEIEVLLKYYQTNYKFLKYYSIKRRTLIEIEKSILRKLKYIRRLNWVSAKPQFMIIRNLPVLPADLRPIFKIQQQLTASDLNRLYQKVIYRNDRLKRFLKNSTTSNSFEMLFAQRMLQEAVDNLIENGKDLNSIEVDNRGRPLKSLGELLKGKKGRFRQNLLGKRVDYSGRSVIVVGPKLKLHECGLPIEMAIELFLPFLIKEILKNKYSLTVRSAKLYIKKNRIQITQLLRQIVKRQPILLNRAPTLHRLGIQAFLPKLVEGKAILLHPLVCSAFNADFDGDQMAVHVPITNEARIEAWKLILSRNNLLSPATGEPVLLPSQDMVLGCYYLTIENLYSLIQKQQTIYKKINNQASLVFGDFENIFNAYQRNQIHLHTIIWMKFNNNLESDSVFHEPEEIQIQLGGQYTKIYQEYYQKFNRKGDMYNQIIKTTTGRILFNLMLNNCLN